jgi:hypothetical protein
MIDTLPASCIFPVIHGVGPVVPGIATVVVAVVVKAAVISK